MFDPGEDVTAVLDQPGTVLAPGLTFAGRYLIIEELGRGGMGRVYRAVDQLVDDEIALKLISPEIAAGPGTIEQFGRELKIARRIVHKNVGRMHDLSEDRGVTSHHGVCSGPGPKADAADAAVDCRQGPLPAGQSAGPGRSPAWGRPPGTSRRVTS